MRLDTLLSPSTAIGFLSAILTHSQLNTVHGFSFSRGSNEIRQRTSIISNSRHNKCTQRAIICTHGKLILAASSSSSSSSSGDENSIIDATIEEKTAGLASLEGDDGEENTSVSTYAHYAHKFRCAIIINCPILLLTQTLHATSTLQNRLDYESVTCSRELYAI